MNYWLEDPNGKGTLLRTNQITPADQFQATGIVMLSDSYLNDNLGVTLAGNGALTGELLLVSAQINYQWTDAWNSSLQYTTISADSSTPFAMMDGISLWYASLSWTN